MRPAVRAVARYVLGRDATASDVDDCAGEAFRRAVEGLGGLRAGVPLRPWFLGIARHVALDARRALRRAHTRSDDSRPLEDLADATTPGADQSLVLAERMRRLHAALGALPDEQRRAVLMHAEGHGYREIGSQLSAPIGTVCTWISRARRELARALADRMQGEDA